MLNRIIRSHRIPAIAGAVLVIAVIGGGTATAANLITSTDVKDDSLRSSDVHDGSLKVRDLTDRAVSTLQNGGGSGATGTTGAAGATGAQGPKGDKGDAPAAQYGVATVNVKRGTVNPASAWATYSTALGSPVGDTTSGSFRFTCSDAQAPCTVAVKAAALGTGSGTVAVYPRVLIMRQDFNNGGPSSYCEYGDGSTGAAAATINKQVSSATPAYTAMQVNIGGSADCGGPDSTAGNVDQITVPSGFYDVQSTFVFLS